MSEIRDKWDSRYRARFDTEPTAALVLREYAHLLPRSGVALDLACGRGGNALWLARAGLQVRAWDISPVAIESLQQLASQQGLAITATVRDVVLEAPPPASFDVIVVSNFLERTLSGALCAALRPGGLLFYQTFVADRVGAQGPGNPAYLLAQNELREMFAPLTLRVYREEGTLGDITQGLRNEALLIAQRQSEAAS